MLTAGSLIVAIITGVVTPYMLNPDALNWQNYAGFFWVCIFPCVTPHVCQD